MTRLDENVKINYLFILISIHPFVVTGRMLAESRGIPVGIEMFQNKSHFFRQNSAQVSIKIK